MPGAQKRLAEIESLMGADNFWGNQTQAQKFIDEASILRKKVDPLLEAENKIADFRVMLELSEGEPASDQPRLEAEMLRDLSVFAKGLDAIELRVLLNGPHDRNSCILSINAGAGGTESCAGGGGLPAGSGWDAGCRAGGWSAGCCCGAGAGLLRGASRGPGSMVGIVGI